MRDDSMDAAVGCATLSRGVPCIGSRGRYGAWSECLPTSSDSFECARPYDSGFDAILAISAESLLDT